MTSTTDTQFLRSSEAFADALTQLLEGAAEGAAEVARESTNTYIKGLNAAAERQKLPFPYQGFQQWAVKVLEGAAEVARESTNTYIKGLNAIAKQQGLAYRVSQQWVAGVTDAQGEIRQQLLDSYDAARGGMIKSVEESAKLAGNASTEVAEAGSSAVAGASHRRQAVAETRRGPAAATEAGRSGPATWTGEAYESLTAAEIIEKLPLLSQQKLTEVESYEKAHQSRQTVMQKIASLRGREPVPGYDELNVQEISKRLADGDPELAARVREYERPRKGRDGVLHAAEAQLSRS